MTTLARVRRHLQVIRTQQTLIRAQRLLIQSKNREIELLHLECARDQQALFASWLISLERPEIDMRETLAYAERDLGEKIAILEEHIL